MTSALDIPIRVLIIEDTDDDKELVLRQLKKGGYKPEYICIQTRDELLAALNQQSWDIILCDYSMPKFDGLAALQIVNEQEIDIPFILISGTVGEDIAVEAMKAGAQDYLMKDNLIRLVPVVKRELADAKIRKEKRLIDEEYRNQNAVLEAIINNSHSIIIFMLDNEYRYLGFNENHRKAMKTVYDVNIELGMNILDLIDQIDNRTKAKASMDRVLLGESFIETQFQPEVNSYYEFHWNAVRKDDFVIGVSCFIVDITKRKQVEIQLQNQNKELCIAKERAEKSEEKIRQIFDNSTVVHYSHDLDNFINYMSPEIENILGYTPDEITDRWTSLISDNPINEIALKNTIKAIETGEKQEPYQVEFIHKNGKRVLVEAHEAPVVKDGKTISIIGSFADITERKKTEIKLAKAKERAEKSEERLSSVFDTMSEGFSIQEVICDEEGKPIDLRFIEANPAFERQTGLKNSETLGHTLLELFPSSEKYWIERYGHVGLTGEATTFEAKFGPLDKYYHCNAFQIKHGFFGTMFTDINDRKEAENLLKETYEKIEIQNVELKNAIEKAEESDRLKSAFLANMSHEIRTPMNGILGFSNLLKEPKLSGEQQQQYIDIIEKSGVRMLNIINDIIDISKIEAGLININSKKTNINDQIEYMYKFFKPEVQAKGMKMKYTYSLPAKEAIIETDKEKVFAILTNLIKNAIKYTQKGSIEFGYEVVKTQQDNSSIQTVWLQFYVKDTGIGIHKDRQYAIFERFIQADIIDIKARQGAGLGLSITKAYVEMLGGRIWVDSVEGLGSTFYFTLPYNNPVKHDVQSVTEGISSASESATNGLKVLIAEDDDTSEQLVSIIVGKLSKEILKVKTGVEAIESCRQNSDIDLILMDIQMPDLNGYEATRKIRQFNKDVIIIAQTAYGLAGDREKAIEAGCNDYVSKPINKEGLLTLIEKYINK